jgi:DNA helicase HerA-like ATPase
LYSRDLQNSPNAGLQERRATETPGGRSLGHVIACDGANATISARIPDDAGESASLWSVGRLVTIAVGGNRVVALTRSMQVTSPFWADRAENAFQVQLELVGEVRRLPDGTEKFSSGISTYPYLGAQAHQIRSSDLIRIYDHGKRETCIIGRLSQDESIDAAIHMPSMLSKHFAIVGSTGSGKSTAVSLLLREAVASDPKLRVLILDPHNEFAAAFPDTAVVIETGNLDLPFWLFRLEEFAEVLFRGRPAVPDELDALRDLIPEAKKSFRGTELGPNRRVSERNGLTADTPVPYRIADLMALIDERIGKLDGRNEKPYLRALKLRLAAAVNDPRYKFMFSSNTITDTINETIASIFRIPGGNRPISTFQLAGIPSEVVNSVASVLCRMAFEIALWSKGAIRILVVCEEAHRYVPSDPNLGFFPTRQAIARIAKEGRKYGVSLGIITQRPGELDQTILSQCSTVFSLRLANDRDQEIIGKALPDSSASALSFISSLANGEAIAFGEAVPVPMRLKFNRVQENILPAAHGADAQEGELDPSSINLSTIVERMRSTGGPDISDFQSRVAAAEASIFDAVLAGGGDSSYDLPVRSAPVSGSESLEPYRPGMLPGQAHLDPGQETRADTRIDRYARMGSDPRADRNTHEQLLPPSTRPQAPGGNSWDPQSRRESLLKKPLDSLLKR